MQQLIMSDTKLHLANPVFKSVNALKDNFHQPDGLELEHLSLM